MKCQTISRPKRKICIGDLDTLLTIQLRSIAPPSLGSVDFSENFTEKHQLWAMVKTVSGETIFDEVNQERDITHHIYTRYRSDVTAEDWVLLDSDRLDVLTVEDLDNRHEFILLRCSNRGVAANEAAES